MTCDIALRRSAAIALFLWLPYASAATERSKELPVRNIVSISSTTAAAAVEAGIAEATRRSVNVCVVVLDEAGRFVAARCMDGVTNAAFDVALAKARHAANFRRPTSFQEELLTQRNALQVLSIPGMLPLAGGLPLEYQGQQIGAVGVSGAASEVDAEIAAAAQMALQHP